jgi:hypothetical protein
MTSDNGDNTINNDNYDPDDPENYIDVDTMMERVIGNEPEAGEPFSIADEVEDDERALD